jgi:hypothetical protein
MTSTHEQTAVATVGDVANRVLGAALGAMETLSIYVGDRLGWYRSLVDDGPATAVDHRAGGCVPNGAVRRIRHRRPLGADRPSPRDRRGGRRPR